MSTNTTAPPSSRARVLSEDLSALVGEKSLVKLVFDAVQTLDPEAVARAGRTCPGYRPQMMLSLLAYCYSVKRYGSQDIEDAMGVDRMVTYLCARSYPDWQSLRRFRRQQRDLLEQCLAYVMKQVWALEFDQGEADYIGYEWFEAELVQEIQSVLKERLSTAALMDGVESD